MSGIFRDVYLLKRPEKAIRDYHITTELDADIAKIDLTVSFHEPVEVRVKIEDKNGAVVSEGVIDKNGKATFEIVDYKLWNTENPYLYTIIFETAGGDCRSYSTPQDRNQRSGNLLKRTEDQVSWCEPP